MMLDLAEMQPAEYVESLIHIGSPGHYDCSHDTRRPHPRYKETRMSSPGHAPISG
jgi:hypothetical protein